MADRDETYRKLIQEEPKNVDKIVSLLPEEMEMRFMDDVLNKLSLHDEHYNGKYFNKLVEFLLDELPNIGEEQPFEGSVCNSNLSSSSMDEDVDGNQTHSEADCSTEPEDNGLDSDLILKPT